jgi:hypothetical protein
MKKYSYLEFRQKKFHESKDPNSDTSEHAVSVVDPDQGSGAFLIPGSGMENISDPGSGAGMNIPDFVFENLL